MHARRLSATPWPARALLLLLAAPVACVQTQVVSREPEAGATVKEIRAKRFDAHYAELELLVEVENPGADVRLYAADFELAAQGQPFAVGRTGLYGELKAGTHAAVLIPIHLAYRDLPPHARARAKAGQPVHLVARGSLLGLGGSVNVIPFDGEGELTVAMQ